MRRRLPPFAALRAFEAAARYNSFKKAAEDICLSASAVSHQVRSLEEFLGVQLFYRESGKPILTTAGAAYLANINEILDRLDAATSDISGLGKRRSLVVNVFPSLVSCWLLPRLPVYQSANPDVDIYFLTSYTPIEFGAGDIDLAIRYGNGEWPGMHSDFMLHDELFLVCSPRLLDKLPPIDRLDELSEQTFIHCATDPSEWRQWLDISGYSELTIKRRMDLENRSLVLEAVAGGLGIAIGRLPYVLNYLESGRLCLPYALRLRTGMDYYLVYPEHHSTYANVQSFSTWLLGESQMFNTLVI